MPRRQASARAGSQESSPPAPPLDAQRLIALMPIRPHEVVGDIGAGSGKLTVPLAKYVFDGKVYAVDSRAEALEEIAERVREVRLGNVETVLSKQIKVPLDDGSLDGAVVLGALHRASRPKSMLKETARLVHPGGWVAAIVWINGGGSGRPARKKLSQEDVSAMAAEVGLRRASIRSVDDQRYLLLLHK